MKPKIFLPFLLSLLIFNSSLLVGTVRYVSPTGSSTPPYTSWETAADSIMECINISVFGDTIYVANGTYKERIDMIPGLSLIGAGMDSCVIDTRELSPNYTVMVKDSCYLSGFQIASYSQSEGMGIVIYDVNIQNITSKVDFVKVTNAQTGFRISSSSLGFDGNYKLIRKNIILDVEVGVRCDVTSPYIEENIIYPNKIGLVSGINSSPTYINNTIIMENGSNFGSYGYGPGFHLGSVLKDNSFYIYQGNVGVYSINDSVINNVVTGNPTYGMWTQSGGVVKNNIVKGANTGIEQISGTTPIKYTVPHVLDRYLR